MGASGRIGTHIVSRTVSAGRARVKDWRLPIVDRGSLSLRFLCFCFFAFLRFPPCLRASVPSCLLLLIGCDRSEKRSSTESVVVYCSVDEAVARPILDLYGRRRGIEVRAVYDSEAGKTTGLIQRIVRESQSGRPHADVLWSGEVFNTIMLAGTGLLEGYAPSSAADVPPRFKDAEGRWTGGAVRARVIAFDPQRTPASRAPMRWEDLAKPEIAGRLALANPLFGTTRGHIAALFAGWGEQRGAEFLRQLRGGGVQIVDGNSAAVRAVIAGRADFAATDSDDVWVAKRSGASLDFVYPDLGSGGTLLTPCTAAIIRGGPNAAAARGLVDFLVSSEVERMLAQSEARHIPVRESLRRELNIAWPAESPVDYDAAAAAMTAADQAVREVLLR